MTQDLRTAIHTALRGSGYRTAFDGVRTTIRLDPELIGTSAATGGNAACALLNNLIAEGFSAEPPEWQHLLEGEECVVTRP